MLLLYLCCFVSVVLALPEDCIFRRNRAPRSILTGERFQASGRLAAGTEVDSITKYPFAVQVRYIADFCGGAIISENYILSSAQCLEDYPSPECIEVLAGSVVRGEGTEIPIEEVGIHPEWDRPRYNNDIGYMRTAAPIQFRDEIQPARLRFLEEEHFTVLGWGNHGDDDGRRLNVLNELFLTEVGYGRCQVSHPMVQLGLSVICGETADMDGGICQFDAGDPAVNQDGSLVALGSFSRGCGRGQAPSVFTYLHTDRMRAFITDSTGVHFDD